MFRNLLVLVLSLSFSPISSAAPKAKKVLIIVSGASQLSLKNGEKYQTGYWLEEFSTPYQIFEGKRLRMTIATPEGNRPSVDNSSIAVGEDGKPLYWPSMAELNEALAVKKRVLDNGQVLSLAKLSDQEIAQFDAVFFPGGHGPMEDLINNREVARVLQHFHKHGKPTSLVCHAPIALISTETTKFLYKGYKVTAFSDAEESQTPIGPKMKTTPQKELERAGAIFVKGADWQPYVVEDRELITGQNPASSKEVAVALMKRMGL
ncbi:MAG: type 1 glutamine amidotransferase domain-containing protein [Bdellovibrionota bacterium]